MQIVCSVVLTSGPDEALLGRCALVMADWSTDSKFAKEMGVKPPVGDSIALLTRSVTPATRVSGEQTTEVQMVARYAVGYVEHALAAHADASERRGRLMDNTTRSDFAPVSKTVV